MNHAGSTAVCRPMEEVAITNIAARRIASTSPSTLPSCRELPGQCRISAPLENSTTAASIRIRCRGFQEERDEEDARDQLDVGEQCLLGPSVRADPHAQGDDEPDEGDGGEGAAGRPDRQDPATIGTRVERASGWPRRHQARHAPGDPGRRQEQDGVHDAQTGGEVGGLAQRPTRRRSWFGLSHRLILLFATEALVIAPTSRRPLVTFMDSVGNKQITDLGWPCTW